VTTSEPLSPVKRARAVVALGSGVASGAAGITILSQIMRSVGAVGGSCADGGPYVSAQPCPDGTGSAMMLVLGLALVCVIGTLYGASVLKAPQPVLLGWPAIFLTLGWNFLDDGWFDPPAGAGISGGYIVCGVVFWLMGAGPLLIGVSVLRENRRSQKRQQGPPPVVVTHPHLERPRREPPAPHPAEGVDLPGGDDPRAAAMSVAGRLERLAALHTSGELTDDEYRLAKAATLREEVSG
jgi:hypothetical protein